MRFTLKKGLLSFEDTRIYNSEGPPKLGHIISEITRSIATKFQKVEVVEWKCKGFIGYKNKTK